MGTVTISDQAITVPRNRAGSLPMTWQNPDGSAIDITGFVITAEMRWRNDDPRALAVQVLNPGGGEFAPVWTAEQVADLPLGRIAVLGIKIIDGADGTHDLVLPINGVQP